MRRDIFAIMIGILATLGTAAPAWAGPPAEGGEYEYWVETDVSTPADEDEEEAPAAPVRPRRPRAPTTLLAPGTPVTPLTPLTPVTPVAPVAPRDIAPRGWFGFAMDCDECYVAEASGTKGRAWVFGSLPRIYWLDPDGPADRAGVERGDVLTHIDGISLRSREGGRAFGSVRPGQVVRLTCRRGERDVVVRVKLQQRPDALSEEDRAKIVKETKLDENEFRRLAEELRGLEVKLKREEREALRRVRQDLARMRQERLLPSPAPVARATTTRQNLRYAGIVGDAEVEVRGSGSVIVNIAESDDEVIITTNDARIVIRKSGTRPASSTKSSSKRGE